MVFAVGHALLTLLDCFADAGALWKLVEPLPEDLRVFCDLLEGMADEGCDLSDVVLAEFLTAVDEVIDVLSRPVGEAGF